MKGGTVDSLRNRIAAAIKSEAERRGIWRIADFDYPFLADAVIEELGMTIERDGPPIVPPCHRYVTEWVADE